MKAGTIITIVLTVAGLCAVVFAFVKNSSPYVTVAQAKASDRPSVHLAGDIDKSTVTVGRGTVSFLITDEKGDTAQVVFSGPPPANMGEATKVVAIGAMKNGVFEAHKLLLKCPSKYESEAGPTS
jgi:cytochrome c-type biogenesis protein CcmE